MGLSGARSIDTPAGPGVIFIEFLLSTCMARGTKTIGPAGATRGRARLRQRRDWRSDVRTLEPLVALAGPVPAGLPSDGRPARHSPS